MSNYFGKLVLPGRGAAQTFVYAQGKLSQSLVVLSGKTKGIKDSSFTFSFRNLDI